MSLPVFDVEVVPVVPANVLATAGVSLARANGALTIGLDFAGVIDNAGIPDPSRFSVLAYNKDATRLEEVRVDVLVSTAVGEVRTPRGDANYSILNSDRYVALTAPLTAPRTFTLPAANSVPGSRAIIVQDEVGGISSSNTLTIVPTGSDTINGAVSFVMNGPRAGVEFRSDATGKWSFRVLGTAQIAPNSVDASKVVDGSLTLAKHANAAALSLRGNAAGVAATPADLTVAQVLALLNLNQHGQCVLAKSGTNLVLLPKNGNKLVINGAVQTIPSAGVALAPTGLIAFTLYYVYAYMAAGVMALEASTTGHSTDAATGVEVKTGDATRTLVGMARPITGPAWQDTAAQRFVASYFNRQTKTLIGAALSAVSTTSTTGAELSTAGRAEFLTWGDEAVNVACPGSGRSATTTLLITLFISLDGIAATPQSTEYINTASVNYSMNSSGPFAPSEGYHYVTPGALVNNGSFSGIFDVQVNGLVRG